MGFGKKFRKRMLDFYSVPWYSGNSTQREVFMKNCAVVELHENKCIGYHPCRDVAHTQEVFEKIVREYGVEPTDSLWDDDGNGLFEAENNFTVQTVSQEKT
jgi:hypothetical protein